MGRLHKQEQLFDAGDLEIYHPTCRTRIFITALDLQYGNGGGRGPTLVVEGICAKCGGYVYLALTNDSIARGWAKTLAHTAMGAINATRAWARK